MLKYQDLKTIVYLITGYIDMTNKQVVYNFIRGLKASGNNLKATGSKLFSYYTCLAQRSDYSIIVNMTPYSVTSSKHRTILLRELADRYHIIEVEDVPRGTDSLTEYVK